MILGSEGFVDGELEVRSLGATDLKHAGRDGLQPHDELTHKLTRSAVRARPLG
jgi:hypothetical protein